MKNTNLYLIKESEREQYMDRIDVLDKVKKLKMLGDKQHTSIKFLSEYFGMKVPTLTTYIHRNNEVLVEDGLKKLEGLELEGFKHKYNMPGKFIKLYIVPKRAALRLAMILKNSDTAIKVRKELTDEEDGAQQEFVPSVFHERKEVVAPASDINVIKEMMKSNNIQILHEVKNMLTPIFNMQQSVQNMTETSTKEIFDLKNEILSLKHEKTGTNKLLADKDDKINKLSNKVKSQKKRIDKLQELIASELIDFDEEGSKSKKVKKENNPLKNIKLKMDRNGNLERM
ncbi:hypothetical protein P9G78_17890 [Bacillus subtilis]|uniref:hypothetical protein n=1 Tax=Bacillus subtilis TaxID=1423 RepID=UPI002DBD244A|nr:hypothetical protein [Bacillus subtilis]MEC2236643.1 hypothetical protein [Bacillus subtilis]